MSLKSILTSWAMVGILLQPLWAAAQSPEANRPHDSTVEATNSPAVGPQFSPTKIAGSGARAATPVAVAAANRAIPAMDQPTGDTQSSRPVVFAYQVRDVRLTPQGTFRARLCSANGVSLPLQPVALQQAGHTLAVEQSRADGQVEFPDVAGGLYEVRVAGNLHHVRLWTSAAAPPVAIPELLVVQDPAVHRAQQPFCSLLGQEPIMIGLLIAAGIAIPIAIHDSGS